MCDEDEDRARMEAWYKARLAKRSAHVGFGRDKNGNYFASFAQDAWDAWREAQKCSSSSDLPQENASD